MHVVPQLLVVSGACKLVSDTPVSGGVETWMARVSFRRHRFPPQIIRPPEIIRRTVWLFFRFTLSFRDVEALLAQRGFGVSYETVRCWTIRPGCRSQETSTLPTAALPALAPR